MEAFIGSLPGQRAQRSCSLQGVATCRRCGERSRSRTIDLVWCPPGKRRKGILTEEGELEEEMDRGVPTTAEGAPTHAPRFHYPNRNLARNRARPKGCGDELITP